MANPAYMTLIDENNNLISGASSVKGRENTIEVLAFKHFVEIPIDKHDGSLTGTRQHGNFCIVKTFCPASPILYKACTSGKTLSSLSLNWYRINDAGVEQAYFRQDLEQVKVVRVAPCVEDVKSENSAYMGHREQVAFRYKKIKWSYLDGNIATEDSWLIRQ